jgi:hypothetical protein
LAVAQLSELCGLCSDKPFSIGLARLRELGDQKPVRGWWRCHQCIIADYLLSQSERVAVEALKAINPAILVEDEIGDIGTGSKIHEAAPDLSKGLTSPAQAKQFVESTGIDILAPEVGNMHGVLKSMVQGQGRKRLDIERIARIKSAMQIP